MNGFSPACCIQRATKGEGLNDVISSCSLSKRKKNQAPGDGQGEKGGEKKKIEDMIIEWTLDHFYYVRNHIFLKMCNAQKKTL